MQEELEQHFLATKQLETQRAQQTVELQQTSEQLKKALAERDTALQLVDPLKIQLTELTEQQEDQTAESELLLLQLHQVQEELEHYFLSYKELEMNFTTLNRRQQDMALLAPHFCTADEITVLSEQIDGEFKTLDCQLDDLDHFGDISPRVNVKVLSHAGQSGLEFRAPTEVHSIPLPGYLQTGADDVSGFMALLPATDEGQALIKQLGTTDIQRIKGIATLLKARLQAGMCSLTERSQNLHSADWLVTLDDFIGAFDHACENLTFDAVELKEAYQTPGYEHLWLSIHNLACAGKTLPELSFKLAAKEVDAETFTEFGCLEFRDQDSGIAPFIAWPPAESDEFGPVMALECPATLNEAQHSTWISLASADRTFIDALLEQLASTIEQLEQRGEDLGRPAEHWGQLIAHIAERQPRAEMPAAE